MIRIGFASSGFMYVAEHTNSSFALYFDNAEDMLDVLQFWKQHHPKVTFFIDPQAHQYIVRRIDADHLAVLQSLI